MDESHQKFYDCGESECGRSHTLEGRSGGKYVAEASEDSPAETLNNLPQNLSKDYLLGYADIKEQFVTLHRECNQIFESLQFSRE